MRRIFLRGFSPPASLPIYIYFQEKVTIKHSTLSDLARPPFHPLSPSPPSPETTASRGVNQITGAERAEEKNPIFPGENFSGASKNDGGKW